MLSGRLTALVLVLVVFSMGLSAGCKKIRRMQEKALGLDGKDDDDPKALSVSAEMTGVEDLGDGTYRTGFRVTVDDEDGSLHGGSLEVSLAGQEPDGARTYTIDQEFFESWSAGHGQGYPEETCVVTGTRIVAEGSVVWSGADPGREVRFDALDGRQAEGVGILDLSVPSPSAD